MLSENYIIRQMWSTCLLLFATEGDDAKDVVDAPFPEACKARLDATLSSLVW